MLTIGNFDGVHVGHQALLRRVVERARAKKIPAIAFTFEPHPVKVLFPDRHLHRVFDLSDQISQMEKLGVDALVIEPFSREFSELPPSRFVQEWLFKPFVPDAIVVGYDFSFGKHREGSIDYLKDRGTECGFQVEVVPPVKVAGVVVSSTRVRQAIDIGDMALAAQFLGRAFYVEGLIEKGAGRGRTIGVPTANMRTVSESVPARGVYAAWAVLNAGDRVPAAVNIGFNPTFQKDGAPAQAMSIEAHLIGWSGDLYGSTLRLEFVERLREEAKFPSVEALVRQIRQDIEQVSKILATVKRAGI